MEETTQRIKNSLTDLIKPAFWRENSQISGVV
jgi:hypothetical protein